MQGVVVCYHLEIDVLKVVVEEPNLALVHFVYDGESCAAVVDLGVAHLWG